MNNPEKDPLVVRQRTVEIGCALSLLSLGAALLALLWLTL